MSWFSNQVLKATKELDLGCGVGGGKNNRDIFKVGTQNNDMERESLKILSDEEIDIDNKMITCRLRDIACV